MSLAYLADSGQRASSDDGCRRSGVVLVYACFYNLINPVANEQQQLARFFMESPAHNSSFAMVLLSVCDSDPSFFILP